MGRRSLVWVSVALAACGSGAPSKPGDEGASGNGGVGDGAAGTPMQPDPGNGGSSGSTNAPPFTGGDFGTGPGGSQGDDLGGASGAGAPSPGAAGAPPETAGGAPAEAGAGPGGAAAGDAGAPGAGTGGEAGSAPEPEWSDVVPTRKRVGPRTTPRELFSSEVQFGAYWETPSGDVLTSFRTSITQPQPGIAIDDYNYNLRTIVGDAIEPVPDLDVGTCRYEDWPYGSCSVGPDAAGPSGRSLVADDGTILVVREQADGSDTMHPIVEQLDPATGTFSPVVELTDIQMQASSLAYTANLVLRQLADGSIALSTSMQGDPARTSVFDTAGERLAERAGFAFGERWQRFALFLGETAGAYNARFDWWDPRTDASARAFGFPDANPTPGFRTFVTPVGDVIFPGFTYTDRLVRIDPDGNVVEDRELTAWSFLATFPDGRYLTVEDDATLGYVLRAYDRSGQSSVLYDEATLMEDTQWPEPGSGIADFYPFIAPLEFAAIVDDAGNAYVGLVLETNGNTTTQTYLVAFAPDGEKLWGLKLESTTLGSCQPHGVLSNHRLVVRCPGRYVRRFLILGE